MKTSSPYIIILFSNHHNNNNNNNKRIVGVMGNQPSYGGPPPGTQSLFSFPFSSQYQIINNNGE